MGHGSRLIRYLVLVAALPTCVGPACADSFQDILAFEKTHRSGTPFGWGGGPAETHFVDSLVVHGGRWAAGIERVTESEGSFSALTKSVPVDFGGTTLELRGSLRLRGVTGYAGLWLREDGRSGVVEFDNMQRRQLRGDIEWAEYSIELPLNQRANQIVFGALLVGQGKLWVDDLKLLVDGVPVSEAPKVERVQTALDIDDEFDSGSGLTLTHVTSEQSAHLVVLGKVWGFLKYHHPTIMSGKVHWDYELFRVLPQLLEAGDRAAAAAVLLEWAASLGTPSDADCVPCVELPEAPYLEPDVAWIHDHDLLGDELSTYLQAVYRNRPSDAKNLYVSLHPAVGNPNFSNESAYRDLESVDCGYRLLALFRFWNIIQYWSPYRDLVEGDWHDVLEKFVPRFVAAANDDAYQLELLALAARVYDTHTNVWSAIDVRPPGGECRLPVSIRFVEGKAVVTGLVDTLGTATGLAAGDVIERLDGESVEAKLERWAPYYAASNEPTRLRDLARFLTRGDCGTCTVSGSRGDKAFELTLERVGVSYAQVARWHSLPGAAFRKLSDDVAYLTLASVEADHAEQYIREALGTRGLIVDIRNYPSEFVVFALGRHFVAEKTPFARFTNADPANPGAFVWTQPVSLTPKQPHYAGKIVILIDEVSQSQAEYTTMAFRAAPDAVVVGSTTAGADGNASPFALPGGMRTMISGIGVFYPDKTPTQRIGIVPNVTIWPTIRGIREGRDEVLEEGIRQILGGDVPEEEIRRLAKP